jgi:hypothetical protein
MVANDDLKGKTIHFTSFYTRIIFGPKILKPFQRVPIATAILDM